MKGGFGLRLTLWNAAIIAVIVLMVGWGMSFASEQLAQRALDNDLLDRALRAGPGPRPDRAPDGPGPNPMEPRMVRPPEGPKLNELDPESRKIVLLRRPRISLYDGSTRELGELTDPWDEAMAAQSARGVTLFKTISTESYGPLRIASAPVIRDGRIDGWVQVAGETKGIESLRRTQAMLLLVLTPTAFVLAGVGGLFLARRAIKPIRQLTQSTESVSLENLDVKIPVEGNDELAQLTESFNRMTGRLAEAFREQERLMEAQKRFAADASHELRTPIARIKLIASAAALEDDIPPDIAERFSKVEATTDEMSTLVAQLIELARADGGLNLSQADFTLPSEIAATAIEAAGFKNDPDVHLRVESEQPLRINSAAIERALVNLLTNARRHTPVGNRIEVIVDHSSITVADQGEGIPPDHLPKLTQRFYRVDESRTAGTGGLGLGLSIVQSIIHAHGGTLSITSEPGKGTKANMTFPESASKS